jgi:hypothetical protein
MKTAKKNELRNGMDLEVGGNRCFIKTNDPSSAA